MSAKQIAVRLSKLSGKIKSRQEELSTWKEQAKDLRTELATAKAKEKDRKK